MAAEFTTVFEPRAGATIDTDKKNVPKRAKKSQVEFVKTPTS